MIFIFLGKEGFHRGFHSFILNMFIIYLVTSYPCSFLCPYTNLLVSPFLQFSYQSPAASLTLPSLDQVHELQSTFCKPLKCSCLSLSRSRVCLTSSLSSLPIFHLLTDYLVICILNVANTQDSSDCSLFFCFIFIVLKV